MLVMNQKGMQHLLASKFKVGADASAAAGPVGREAAADTDWEDEGRVVNLFAFPRTFCRHRSQWLCCTQDRDGTHVIYGKMVPFEAILTGKVPAPKESLAFLAVVQKYAPQAMPRGTSATPPAQ